MTYKDIAVMVIQRAIYDYQKALEKDNASVAYECEKFFIHSNLMYWQNVPTWQKWTVI